MKNKPLFKYKELPLYLRKGVMERVRPGSAGNESKKHQTSSYNLKHSPKPIFVINEASENP